MQLETLICTWYPDCTLYEFETIWLPLLQRMLGSNYKVKNEINKSKK